ncbi:MAG TPA: hypothetical protein VGH43_05950 [Jatrophihabitans sp.]|jgi:hypothetical protein
MRKFTKKQYLAAGAAAVIIAGGAGAAFAYWTAGGSGNGSGTVANSNGSVTLHGTFPAATLTPGGSAPVTFTADNPGTSNLYVTAVNVDSIATSDVNCLAGDFSVDNYNAPGTEVAKGASNIPVGTATIHMANTDVSQDACKGATITLTLSST